MEQNKISLSFTKQKEKKILKLSALSSENFGGHKDKSIKYNISSYDNESNFASYGELEDDLIIPLVQSNRAVLLKKLEKTNAELVEINSSEGSTSILNLDEQAAAILIEESRHKLINNENLPSDNLTIVNKPNIQLDIGKDSSLDDYENISIESYGAALLRGMGWGKDKGIGRNRKRIEIIEPTAKTLGMTKNASEKNKQVDEEEEQMLTKGSYVLINNGRNKGTYGTVETIDEFQVLVKPAIGGKVLSEVEQNLKIVTKNEYNDSSRVINKEMYEKYKEDEIKKKEKKRRYQDLSCANSNKNLEKQNKEISEKYSLSSHMKESQNNYKDKEKSAENKKASKREYNGVDSYEKIKHSEAKYKKKYEFNKQSEAKYEKKYEFNNQSEAKSEKKYESKEHSEAKYEKKYESKEHSEAKYEKKYESKEHSEAKYEEKKYGSSKISDVSIKKTAAVIPWARPNLRVRIIDKKYKGGKYHKEKVVIQDVETPDCCTCITDDEKLLWDINPANLETVIPKVTPAIILILKGSNKGQKGRILHLHKEEEKASVQMLSDSSLILKLHYDDICEYVKR